MSSSKVPAPANNVETSVPVNDPIALADAQLDRVAAGLAPAVSVTPADLQTAVCCAVDVATALKPAKLPVLTTTGAILPMPPILI